MPSETIDIALGIVLVLLGCSFAYKFVLAAVMGRTSYWSGFLPISVVSPFFLHLPAGKRSLIRQAEGLWIHLLMAPIFLILAVLCLAAGADELGVPGTAALNWVLNGADTYKPNAVIFDKRSGYRFPIMTRAYNVFSERFNRAKVPLQDKDKLY
jgi:hypothetical protein